MPNVIIKKNNIIFFCLKISLMFIKSIFDFITAIMKNINKGINPNNELFKLSHNIIEKEYLPNK